MSYPGWARTTDARINSPAYFDILSGKAQYMRKLPLRPGAQSGAFFARTCRDGQAIPKSNLRGKTPRSRTCPTHYPSKFGDNEHRNQVTHSRISKLQSPPSRFRLNEGESRDETPREYSLGPTKKTVLQLRSACEQIAALK